MIASRPADRVLYLGDVYDEDEGGAETDRPYVDHFGPAYGTLAKRTAPTPGNHDWDDDGDDAERVDYLAYWRRAKAVRPVTYYAFRAGGWEVLSLNSEEPHDTDSDQYEWLRSRLRGGGTCRLASWHRPRYSAGEEHGDAEDMAPYGTR
jgi:hypothetical protein